MAFSSTKFIFVFSFSEYNSLTPISFVSTQQQKRANAQLEHLAHETEIESKLAVQGRLPVLT